MDVTVTELWIYPIKSCKGIKLDSALLTPEGLEHDRRWAMIDAEGRCLTQRKLPRMALIEPQLSQSNRLTLSTPNTPPISVSIDHCHKRIACRVWSSTVDGILAPSAINQWLSEFLGVNARLVYFDPCYRRALDTARFGQNATGFADAAPYLVANEATLTALQHNIPPIENFSLNMTNFRPNIVISGIDAYSEYHYLTLNNQKWQLKLIDPSIRCSMIGVDSNTGEQLGGSALLKGVAKLSSAKDNPKAPIFGVNSTLIGESFTTIRCGDRARLV